MSKLSRLEVEVTPADVARPEPQAVRSAFEVEHPAGAPVYADWVDVLLPMRQAKRLGERRPVVFRSTSGTSHPAVWHRRAGHQGWRMRVVASFPTKRIRGDFIAADPSQAMVTEFQRHSSLVDLQPPPVFGSILRSSEVIEESAAEVVERFSYTDDIGNATVIFRRLRHLHPVVDYGIRWVRTREGEHYTHLVDFREAASVHVMPWSRFAEVDATTAVSMAVGLSTAVDWACAPTVWARATYPSVEDEGPIEEQLRGLAHLQWPVGRALTWQREDGRGHERWLTLGILPEADDLDVTVMAAKMRELFAAPKSIYAPRPGAQALSANQAGTQRFGAAMGGVAARMSTLDAFAFLRTCAGDEELRPIHWLTDDTARPIMAEDRHKTLRTHNRRIDWRNTKDRLGLESEPPRIAPISRRTADDEQHTDDLGLHAFLGLWSDPALEETLLHQVQLDALDTQRLSGRTNSAARGVGRPLLSMATAAWLEGSHSLAGTAGASLSVASVWNAGASLSVASVWNEVAALSATWEGRDVIALDHTRPVKPIATLLSASWDVRDPRTGQPMRAAAPYEHAAAIVGLLAAAQVLPYAQAGLALELAAQLTQTVLSWAYTDQNGHVRWPFVVGTLQGDELGLALPKAWCDPGTVEFWQTHITGGSWTTWTAAAAYAQAYLASLGRWSDAFPGELATIAAKVREQYRDTGTTLEERFTALPTDKTQAEPMATRPVGVA